MAVIIIKERNPAIKQMLRMQPNDGGPLPPPGMDITQSTGFVASNWKALGFWAMASGFLLFGALFVFIGTQASAKGQKGAEFMMPMGLLFIVTAMITAYRAWKLRTTQGQPLLLLSSDGLIDYRKAQPLESNVTLEGRPCCKTLVMMRLRLARDWRTRTVWQPPDSHSLTALDSFP